jgi:hypothetical protein
MDEGLIVSDDSFEEHSFFGKDHSRNRGLAQLKRGDASNGATWVITGDATSKASICLLGIKESSCLSMKWGMTYGDPQISTEEFHGGITEHWFFDCEQDPEDACHIRYFANQSKCIGIPNFEKDSDQNELHLVDCVFGDSLESQA